MRGRHWLAILSLSVVTSLSSAAWPHGDADWIRQRGFRSTAGVFCCGVSDCKRLPKSAVTVTSGGYAINYQGHTATVAFGSVLPSDDDDFWACWPDGSNVRCFFAPPMGA